MYSDEVQRERNRKRWQERESRGPLLTQPHRERSGYEDGHREAKKQASKELEPVKKGVLGALADRVVKLPQSITTVESINSVTQVWY